MTGKGLKSERETVVRWDDENDVAEIWTASEVSYRRLRKLGYFPTQDNARSATFVLPKRDLRLPKPLDEARSRRTKAMAAAGKVGFGRNQGDGLCDEAPNSNKTGSSGGAENA